MVLNSQVRVMTHNRQRKSFHLASLLLVLCSQPVLCYRIAEDLGMAFLSVSSSVAWCLAPGGIQLIFMESFLTNSPVCCY